jgi:hypothetical protein
MDIKLLFVFFLFGVIMKLYDDLNDNHLFEYYNILKEKDYINHFLIGVFYICLTIIAFKTPFIFLCLTLFFVVLFFILHVMCYDKKAFDKPFEFTCLIISILLTLYLLFFENLIGNIFEVFEACFEVCTNLYLLSDKNKFIYIITIIITITSFYIVNYIEYLLLNIEYSYNKLIIRFLFLTTYIILFVINKNILPRIIISKIIPNIIFYGMVFTIGYYLTSCIFQIILIRKDRIEKFLKKEKKCLKKAKKEKNLLKIQQINTS